MDFMMKILYFVSKIRLPFLDVFFLNVTKLGEEVVFLAVAITFYWCVNKRQGYYILITGLVGTVSNQILKATFKIPRPWVYDNSFPVVTGSAEMATGYSFPSGHTQNAVGTFGAIAKCSKYRPVRIFLIVLIACVAFSRIYLGVHTPVDVIVSLVIGYVLLALLYKVFDTEEHFEKYMPYVVCISFAFALSLLLLAIFLFDGNSADNNAVVQLENASAIFGATVALIPAYFVDRKYIRFDTGARWYAQVIKFVLGLALVLLLKEGLKQPFIYVFGNHFLARGIRYFTVVIFASLIYPLTFKYFSKMKIPFLDRFTEKIKQKIGAKK